jgi:hypothetical protein
MLNVYEHDFPLAMYGKRLDIPNEKQRTKIIVYVMLEQLGMSIEQVSALTGMNRRTVQYYREKGFEILTLSTVAPFILHLDDEQLWRPLYRAGYRTIDEIRAAIRSGEIRVAHEKYGNRGSVPGIGRKGLYKLKVMCGLPVRETKRDKGERGHRQTGRSKIVHTDERKREAMENIAMYRLTHNYKLTQRDLLFNMTYLFSKKYSKAHVINEFTFAQTAKLLKISQRHLKDLEASGELVRNENYRFSRGEILRWAERNLSGWAIREHINKGTITDMVYGPKPEWLKTHIKPLGDRVE